MYITNPIAGTVMYVQSKLFSVGQHLYKPCSFEMFTANASSQSVFTLMMVARKVSVNGMFFFGDPFVNISVHQNTFHRFNLCISTEHMQLCSYRLRIVQRAVRRHLNAKRDLALAMACHPRLGENSPLAALGPDLIALCLSM